MWASQSEYAPRENRMDGRLAALGYLTNEENFENYSNSGWQEEVRNENVEGDIIVPNNIAAINRAPPPSNRPCP